MGHQTLYIAVALVVVHHPPQSPGLTACSYDLQLLWLCAAALQKAGLHLQQLHLQYSGQICPELVALHLLKHADGQNILKHCVASLQCQRLLSGGIRGGKLYLVQDRAPACLLLAAARWLETR